METKKTKGTHCCFPDQSNNELNYISQPLIHHVNANLSQHTWLAIHVQEYKLITIQITKH